MKKAIRDITVEGGTIIAGEVLAYGYEKHALSELLLYLADGTIRKISPAESERVLTIIREHRRRLTQSSESGRKTRDI